MFAHGLMDGFMYVCCASDGGDACIESLCDCSRCFAHINLPT